MVCWNRIAIIISIPLVVRQHESCFSVVKLWTTVPGFSELWVVWLGVIKPAKWSWVDTYFCFFYRLKFSSILNIKMKKLHRFHGLPGRITSLAQQTQNSTHWVWAQIMSPPSPWPKPTLRNRSNRSAVIHQLFSYHKRKEKKAATSRRARATTTMATMTASSCHGQLLLFLLVAVVSACLGSAAAHQAG